MLCCAVLAVLAVMWHVALWGEERQPTAAYVEHCNANTIYAVCCPLLCCVLCAAVLCCAQTQDGKKAWLLLGAAGAAMFGEATLGFYGSKHMVDKVRGTA